MPRKKVISFLRKFTRRFSIFTALPYGAVIGAFTILYVWAVLKIDHRAKDFHVAAIIQTFVFFMGLSLTNISLRFLGKSTEVMDSQNKLTNELLRVEKRRDQQANYVCAWLELKLFDNRADLWADGEVYFLNSSPLPIYEVRVTLTYKQGQTVHNIKPPLGFYGNPMRVIPPLTDSMVVWRIHGFFDDNEEKAITLQPRMSQDWTQHISLVQEGLTRNDFKSLGVRIQFRCADGSEWVRDETGRLVFLEP